MQRCCTLACLLARSRTVLYCTVVRAGVRVRSYTYAAARGSLSGQKAGRASVQQRTRLRHVRLHDRVATKTGGPVQLAGGLTAEGCKAEGCKAEGLRPKASAGPPGGPADWTSQGEGADPPSRSYDLNPHVG